MNANRMITGTIATSAVVNRYCQSRMYRPRKRGIATVRGCRLGSWTRTKAAAYSFHVLTNTKMIAVTMPGHTSGSAMRNSACTRPTPSIRAASSISLGTEAKKACMIQIANDRLNAPLIRMSATQTMWPFQPTNSWYRPMASTVGCSICVISTTSRNASRPGNRNRAM